MPPIKYKLFKNFLAMVWKHLGLPEPTPAQYDMADYLQFGPKRAVIEAFRGVGKSWITAAFVIWVLYHDPQKKIMVVSASKERADAFSTFVQRLIFDIEELHFLRPQRHQRFSKISFDVGPARPDQSPSVKSTGITGQITGSRADMIVADDIEVPKNSFTSQMREKLAEAIKEFDAVLKPAAEDFDPRILFLGTPQSEMSIYNRLPARGYEIRIWPARIPVEPSKYGGQLAPFVMDMIERGAKARAPVDIRRFTDGDLTERELSYGRSGFALQFMLDTSLSDAERYPLKIEDLMVMGLDAERGPCSLAYGKDPRKNLLEDLDLVGFTGDHWYAPMWIDPGFTPYQGSVLAIDPSGRGQDETGYAVVKMLHGRLYLMASGGLLGGATPDNLKALANVAKAHKVNAVRIEDNFGDGMWGSLFRPVLTAIYPVTIEGYHSAGMKETRILAGLEPVIQGHRLVIDRSVIEKDLQEAQERHNGVSYSLFHQMTRLTRQRGALAHDDRIEALFLAVDYWLEQIAVDENKAAADDAAALLDEQLREFVDGTGFGFGDEGRGGNTSWTGA